MKNRIVILFSHYNGVNKANILYNNYIKELKKFIIFIKNFYKKTLPNWLFKKKQIIFAIIVFILTVSFKFKLQAKPKAHSLNLALDSDIINMPDSIENNDDDYIRNIVEQEANLIVPKNVPKNHLLVMFKEARKNNIPIQIFFRWIYAESTWNKKAKSKDGAIGYTQLMPSTYKKYCKELKIERSATNNIKIGAFYLKEMYNYWANRTNSEKRRWALALASYNGNIIRVKQKNDVPSASVKYVNFILKKYE